MPHLCHDCKVIQVEISRVYVDRQGYTKRGEYYGTGAPIYNAVAHVPYQDQTTGEWDTKEKYLGFRAGDMSAAKAHVKKLYPTAKFTK